MTKRDLIAKIQDLLTEYPRKDVAHAVEIVFESMVDAMTKEERIEIRGFGSFSLHFRPPRVGRNPKTGDAVTLSGKYVPHFKPGKELRERVNNRDDHGGDGFL